tara:strand:+ start:361 stop:561 length:201 start_codon:yes stop_codon:yes gene_type:complete
MYNINKYTIKDIINQELELLNDENFQNYWGSEIQIKNEIDILNFTKVEMKDREDIVEWYERLLKKY